MAKDIPSGRTTGNKLRVPKDNEHLFRRHFTEGDGRQRYASPTALDLSRVKLRAAIARARHLESLVSVRRSELETWLVPPAMQAALGGWRSAGDIPAADAERRDMLVAWIDKLWALHTSEIIDSTAQYDTEVRMQLAACIDMAVRASKVGPDGELRETAEGYAYRLFGRVFPELAQLLDPGALRDAIDLWRTTRGGRPRKGETRRDDAWVRLRSLASALRIPDLQHGGRARSGDTRPPKAKWIATNVLAVSLGLPSVLPDSIEREWSRWSSKTPDSAR